MKRIMCVIGTRPEAIKMAPVIKALKNVPIFKVYVLATAQHRHLMDQTLDVFDIIPDFDLDTMTENQDLIQLTAKILLEVGKVLDRVKPNTILIQGDTTTVMAVALAAFYRQIPIGHIEAGLRTGNILNPFPEEANRLIAARLANWHFAPTEKARANLLRENINPDHIVVTGNTVIDSLLDVAAKDIETSVNFPDGSDGILVTTHRRENFGIPLVSICKAIRKLALLYDNLFFLYPVHPNPNVKKTVDEILGDIRNVLCCAPLDYVSLVGVLKRAKIVLTDSGGLQEEAPALGKPVLVLRQTTERPEVIDSGCAKLIGMDEDRIVAEVEALMFNESAYQSMSKKTFPYGDGRAAIRIADFLIHFHTTP